MLKLLKYEWKACARTCLPVYGGVLAVALVNYLLGLPGQSVPTQGTSFPVELMQIIAAFGYFGVMVALFVITAVLLIQRFYKSLLSDEGYLMFTLPVSAAKHLWTKTIIAAVMCVLSGIAAMLSVGVLSDGFGVVLGVGRLIAQVCTFAFHSGSEFLLTLELLLFCLICGVCGILFVYLCIALGHLARKHRVLMAIVWFFVLSTVVQFCGVMLLIGIGNLPLQSMYQAIEGLLNGMQPYTVMHLGMLSLCIGAMIPTAVCFCGTRYILKNRLNLE